MIEFESAFKFDIHVDASHARCFRVQWSVPESLPFFNGHFPNQPILPGVATVDASVEIIRRGLGLEKLDLKSMQTAKFMAPILPGVDVEIECKEMKEGVWSVEWRSQDQQGSPATLARLSLGF